MNKGYVHGNSSSKPPFYRLGSDATRETVYPTRLTLADAYTGSDVEACRNTHSWLLKRGVLPNSGVLWNQAIVFAFIHDRMLPYTMLFSQYSPYSDSSNPVDEPDHDLSFYQATDALVPRELPASSAFFRVRRTSFLIDFKVAYNSGPKSSGTRWPPLKKFLESERSALRNGSMTSLQTTSNSMRSFTFKFAAAGSTRWYSSRNQVATFTTVSSCASCFQIPVELIRSGRSTRVFESALLCWMKTSVICTILCTWRKIVRVKASLVPRRATHQRRIDDVTEKVLVWVWYAILPHCCAGIELKITCQQCRLVGRYRNVLPQSGSDASSPPLSRKPKPRIRLEISAEEDLRPLPRLRYPW